MKFNFVKLTNVGQCGSSRNYFVREATMDLSRIPRPALAVLRSEPVMLVDRVAIQRNFSKLSALTSGRCAAIVKGDAYGHGMLPSAIALHEAGADLFFTARFEDAVSVREALGVSPQIGVLDGVPRTLFQEAFDCNILPVINSLEQLQAFADFAGRKGARLKAFVHIDTAMNRLGITHSNIKVAENLLKKINVQAYMTHFASADDLDLELCRLQLSRLRAAVERLPPAPLSIANFCGAYLGTEFHGDIIRPGKSTFGINPLPEEKNPLEEAATVLALIIQLRDLKKGDPVGYSSTWRAPGVRRIALLAIGYANGYQRAQSNRGQVAFCGQKAPVLGRVSMDLTAVDVTELPSEIIHDGALAEIVETTISYRDLAMAANTNEHEALISLGRGCRRIHI